jgi:hypothetical protein
VVFWEPSLVPSIMARKVAGIMARRVRADIGRLAAAIGRDPGTAGNFGSERLGRLSQTVWWWAEEKTSPPD